MSRCLYYPLHTPFITAPTVSFAPPFSSCVHSLALLHRYDGSSGEIAWDCTGCTPRLWTKRSGQLLRSIWIIDLDLVGITNGLELAALTYAPHGSSPRLVDQAMNSVPDGLSDAGLLNEKVVPLWTASVRLNNDVQLLFSEPVYWIGSNLSTIIALSIQGGAVTLGPRSSFTAETPTVHVLSLDLRGIPDGAELLTVDMNQPEGRLVDEAGNAPLSDPITLSLNEKVAPTFTIDVEPNNTVLLVFSEPVQRQGGGAPTAADLYVELTGGSAVISSVAVEAVSESVLRLDLQLDGSSDGSELLTVDVLPGAVLDLAGNSALPAPVQASLEDHVAPTFALTMQWDNTLELQWSELVRDIGGVVGPRLLSAFDVNVSGGNAVRGSGYALISNSTVPSWQGTYHEDGTGMRPTFHYPFPLPSTTAYPHPPLPPLCHAGSLYRIEALPSGELRRMSRNDCS